MQNAERSNSKSDARRALKEARKEDNGWRRLARRLLCLLSRDEEGDVDVGHGEEGE